MKPDAMRAAGTIVFLNQTFVDLPGILSGIFSCE
jgi:hypothetical protein